MSLSGVAAARTVTSCRVCGARSFEPIIALGAMPLANALIHPHEAGQDEPRYPLDAVRCTACGLVQLSVVVPPEAMFRHYLYTTSSSRPMVDHFREYAKEIVDRFVPAGGLVIEIGSNDGALLRPLKKRGVRAVGIEPAQNVAAVANAAGLETWSEFFSADVASRIVDRHGPADAVLANNVLAHIDDLGGILEGLEALLSKRGVFVAEVPYLRDLLEHVQYDTIYHEHLSYFAVNPLARLFDRGGLELIDVRRVRVHGGSLRVFAGRRGRHPRNDSVHRMISQEGQLGLATSAPYRRFAAAVLRSRETLCHLLVEARAANKSVAALGASAKGNTLLNYCGIDTTLVRWIADSTPSKQGLLAPGTHIPIRPEGSIAEERPDLTLLLAWNYAEAITRRFREYIAAGGRFIHPIPVARVLEP